MKTIISIAFLLITLSSAFAQLGEAVSPTITKGGEEPKGLSPESVVHYSSDDNADKKNGLPQIPIIRLQLENSYGELSANDSGSIIKSGGYVGTTLFYKQRIPLTLLDYRSDVEKRAFNLVSFSPNLKYELKIGKIQNLSGEANKEENEENKNLDGIIRQELTGNVISFLEWQSHKRLYFDGSPEIQLIKTLNWGHVLGTTIRDLKDKNTEIKTFDIGQEMEINYFGKSLQDNEFFNSCMVLHGEVKIGEGRVGENKESGLFMAGVGAQVCMNFGLGRWGLSTITDIELAREINHSNEKGPPLDYETIREKVGLEYDIFGPGQKNKLKIGVYYNFQYDSINKDDAPSSLSEGTIGLTYAQ